VQKFIPNMNVKYKTKPFNNAINMKNKLYMKKWNVRNKR